MKAIKLLRVVQVRRGTGDGAVTTSHGERDTGHWEGSGKYPIGTADISLLFLTCIQDGCRI